MCKAAVYYKLDGWPFYFLTLEGSPVLIVNHFQNPKPMSLKLPDFYSFLLPKVTIKKLNYQAVQFPRKIVPNLEGPMGHQWPIWNFNVFQRVWGQIQAFSVEIRRTNTYQKIQTFFFQLYLNIRKKKQEYIICWHISWLTGKNAVW